MRFSEGILDQFCSVQGRFDEADVSPLGKSDATLGDMRQNSPELISRRHPLGCLVFLIPAGYPGGHTEMLCNGKNDIQV